MKIKSRILIYSVAGLVILLLLFAWFQILNKNEGTAGSAMLQDESVTPAPYALIRLQELPVFPIDDTGKSFATMDDQEDRSGIDSTDDNPVIIQELRPK